MCEDGYSRTRFSRPILKSSFRTTSWSLDLLIQYILSAETLQSFSFKNRQWKEGSCSSIYPGSFPAQDFLGKMEKSSWRPSDLFTLIYQRRERKLLTQLVFNRRTSSTVCFLDNWCMDLNCEQNLSGWPNSTMEGREIFIRVSKNCIFFLLIYLMNLGIYVPIWVTRIKPSIIPLDTIVKYG